MLENLYGSIPDEAKAIAEILKKSSTRETAHPDDRPGWSEATPTYGHCDIYTDYCRRIWGKTKDGHWNSEASILVWWVYKDQEAFETGVRKNKLTVHYCFKHPKYGVIDLSNDQFPDKTFLYPRYPLPHSVPVGRGWDKSSDIPNRKKIFETEFIGRLMNSSFAFKITPELERFLSEF